MNQFVQKNLNKPGGVLVTSSFMPTAAETTVSKQPAATDAHQSAGTRLDDWEVATVELFVRAAQLIGVPKSMGQIYGLLFCAEGPLPMDEVVLRLGISKGSASQGLRTLRQIGAVKTVFQPGDRRDHYQVELKLRRLVAGFLSGQVEPHLESGASRLEHIAELAARSTPAVRARAEQRLRILHSWRDKSAKIVPLVQRIL